MNKDFIRNILDFDRAQLIDGMESVRDAMGTLDGSASSSSVSGDEYEDAFRMHEGLIHVYNLLGGALEIHDGTRESDVMDHPIHQSDS